MTKQLTTNQMIREFERVLGAASPRETEQITVAKYSTPIPARGFDFMASNASLEDDRAIYGYGSTEEAAIADYRQQVANITRAA